MLIGRRTNRREPHPEPLAPRKEASTDPPPERLGSQIWGDAKKTVRDMLRAAMVVLAVACLLLLIRWLASLNTHPVIEIGSIAFEDARGRGGDAKGDDAAGEGKAPAGASRGGDAKGDDAAGEGKAPAGASPSAGVDKPAGGNTDRTWRPSSESMEHALRTKWATASALWSDPYALDELDAETRDRLQSRYDPNPLSREITVRPERPKRPVPKDAPPALSGEGVVEPGSLRVEIPMLGTMDLAGLLRTAAKLTGTTRVVRGTVVFCPQVVEGYFSLSRPRSAGGSVSVHHCVPVAAGGLASALDRVLHVAANCLLLQCSDESLSGSISDGQVLAALTSMRLLCRRQLGNYTCFGAADGAEFVKGELDAVRVRGTADWGSDLARYHRARALVLLDSGMWEGALSGPGGSSPTDPRALAEVLADGPAIEVEAGEYERFALDLLAQCQKAPALYYCGVVSSWACSAAGNAGASALVKRATELDPALWSARVWLALDDIDYAQNAVDELALTGKAPSATYKARALAAAHRAMAAAGNCREMLRQRPDSRYARLIGIEATLLGEQACTQLGHGQTPDGPAADGYRESSSLGGALKLMGSRWRDEYLARHGNQWAACRDIITLCKRTGATGRLKEVTELARKAYPRSAAAAAEYLLCRALGGRNTAAGAPAATSGVARWVQGQLATPPGGSWLPCLEREASDQQVWDARETIRGVLATEPVDPATWPQMVLSLAIPTRSEGLVRGRRVYEAALIAAAVDIAHLSLADVPREAIAFALKGEPDRERARRALGDALSRPSELAFTETGEDVVERAWDLCVAWLVTRAHKWERWPEALGASRDPTDRAARYRRGLALLQLALDAWAAAGPGAESGVATAARFVLSDPGASAAGGPTVALAKAAVHELKIGPAPWAPGTPPMDTDQARGQADWWAALLVAAELAKGEALPAEREKAKDPDKAGDGVIEKALKGLRGVLQPLPLPYDDGGGADGKEGDGASGIREKLEGPPRADDVVELLDAASAL